MEICKQQRELEISSMQIVGVTQRSSGQTDGQTDMARSTGQTDGQTDMARSTLGQTDRRKDGHG